MLVASRESSQGTLRRRYVDVGTLLAGGANVSAALNEMVPELNHDQISAISVGERSGRLRSVLSALLQREHRDIDLSKANLYQAYVYLVIVLCTTALLLGAMTVFILPKFEKIFDDFDVTMPALTTWVLESGICYTPVFSAIAVITLFLMAGWSLKGILSIGLSRQKRVPLFDAISWYSPFTGYGTRSRQYAEAFHLLAEGVEGGVPLHHVCQQIAASQFNHVLVVRMDNMKVALHRGADLAQAAEESGLPKIVQELLRHVRDERTTVETLRFLSNHYFTCFSRFQAFLQSAVLPIAVLAVSVVVGMFSIAMFLPLVKLITNTATFANGGY